jgi:hypothetical protein
MMVRVLWSVAMSALSVTACFFVAGNLDPFSWDGPDRAFTVLIAVVVFGLTATCPYIKESKNA